MKIRRLPLVAPLAALAVLAGLVPATATSAGGTATVTVNANAAMGPINEGLLGTNQPVSGAGPVIQPLGVDWERADMSLDGSYSCADGSWDPSMLDARVQADIAMGGQPELLVDYSPPCMTTNPLHETLDPPNAGGYLPWQSLVEEAAYHEITKFGVRIFEVWNEPDGTFWHGTLADYLALYKATAAAVEHAASRAGVSGVLIGGPALLFSDSGWLEPFLAYVDANHLPLGFVSWHYYGDYPALGPFATGAGTLPPEIPGAGDYWYNPLTSATTYGLQVNQVRSEISKYPDLHPLTVIDEWNLDAGYDPRADQPYDAAFAAAVLDAVQSAGLDRMAFFRVAEDRPGTLGNWGMLFSDLTPKPVYWTFAFWHALAGTRLVSTVSPSDGDVGAVASRVAGGGVNVLLYNYVPYGSGEAEAVTVQLPGLGTGTWTYTLRMVDSVSSGGPVGTGSVTGPAATVRLEMPAESVALVELQPS